MRIRKAIAFGAAGLATTSLACLLTVARGARNTSPPESKSDSLADLESRITTLESIDEPFTVFDRQGKRIFSVGAASNDSSFATLFNSNGQGVATMGATSDGGYFSVRNEDGSRRARLSADTTWAGLSINELIEETVTEEGQTRVVPRDVSRIELGRRPTGSYALRFPTKTGELIAGIGESPAGSGAMIVGDASGGKRASQSVGSDGKGLIIIFNATGVAIAAMGEATGNTGGEFAIADSAGAPRVKMGTNGNRYGVVMALPTGLPYVPKSGLPGSYMLGCAGGASCVP